MKKLLIVALLTLISCKSTAQNNIAVMDKPSIHQAVRIGREKRILSRIRGQRDESHLVHGRDERFHGQSDVLGHEHGQDDRQRLRKGFGRHEKDR